MKKLGFTLAEVLITLMILGVIAAMTVPTLIQDTQKKEQIVQIKKGLSMINQAITMHYALEQEYISDAWDADKEDASGNPVPGTGLVGMLTKRLAVSDSGNDWVTTGDGLTYIWGPMSGNCSAQVQPDGTGKCFSLIIATAPVTDIVYGSGTKNGQTISNQKQTNVFDTVKTKITGYKGAEAGATTNESLLTGYYLFYGGNDRVIPSKNTQFIMNASNLKGLTYNQLPNANETP